jgi:hypothetical protein
VVDIQWQNIASENFPGEFSCDAFRMRLEAATTLRQPDNSETTQTISRMTRKCTPGTKMPAPRWLMRQKINRPATMPGRWDSPGLSPALPPRLPRASRGNASQVPMMKQKRPLEKRPFYIF